ncbi:AlpA family phage regulatory protein [Falsigemmobacter faecalis]|uniref:AlpA family phage regulatory protein n=1 Tax=Falsigemmobacter faecalis TaxID=2488730 RepID=A0A3P3DD21_9RHOB|nr:AlpA family phage regulatory protein [Falsigemmobacter faecalis]
MVLRVNEVAQRYGVSPATVWHWPQTVEGFPGPVRIGPGTTRWYPEDPEEWDAQARGAAKGGRSRPDPTERSACTKIPPARRKEC